MSPPDNQVSLPFKTAAELAMNVAIRFWQASEYCADKLIIDGLAPIFTDCGDFMASTGDALVTAEAWLVEIFDIVYTLFSRSGLSALLDEHFPGLAAFLDDPIGYITDIAAGITPTLPDWLSDPVGWLLSVLESDFTPLYYLIVDPAGELLYLMAQLFDLTPYEAQSADFVIKALVERYLPFVYELAYLTPGGLWGYLLAAYEDVFESIADTVKDLAEHTVRFFWEGEW